MRIKESIRAVLLAAGGLLWSGSGQAGPVDLVLQGGLDYGGEDLVEVNYLSGKSDSLAAGALFHFAFGLAFPTLPSRAPALETQFTVGWKFDSASGTNSSVSWNRYPVELIQFYRIGKRYNSWRLGAGVTYHLAPTLETKGFYPDVLVEFEDAVGAVIEVDYEPDTMLYFGTRLTLINYTLGSNNIDGNSLGALVGVRF